MASTSPASPVKAASRHAQPETKLDWRRIAYHTLVSRALDDDDADVRRTAFALRVLVRKTLARALQDDRENSTHATLLDAAISSSSLVFARPLVIA